MKNRQIKKIVPFILLVGFLMLASQVYGAENNSRYATMHKIKGQVEVRKEGTSWMPAKEGMILHQMDEVRTYKNSQVQLLLDKEAGTAQLDVKELTRLRLSTLMINDETKQKTTLLDVAVGRVMIHVEKLRGGSKFEVNTPTATMGVRGTKFEVIVEPKEKGKIDKK